MTGTEREMKEWLLKFSWILTREGENGRDSSFHSLVRSNLIKLYWYGACDVMKKTSVVESWSYSNRLFRTQKMKTLALLGEIWSCLIIFDYIGSFSEPWKEASSLLSDCLNFAEDPKLSPIPRKHTSNSKRAKTRD